MKPITPLKKELTESGKKSLGYAGALLLLSVLILFIIIANPSADRSSDHHVEATQHVPTPTHHTSSTRSQAPFADLEITASSALVKDLRTGKVLYEKNPHSTHPLASITKIMSAITAVEKLPDYTVVTITQDALAVDGNNGLHGQERWSLDELLDFSLVSSSNDGIAAIASVGGAALRGSAEQQPGTDVFVDTMNQMARTIGLDDTRFLNPHGLDKNETVSGSYSTASDTIRLMEYAFEKHPALLEPTRHTEITVNSLDELTYTPENTNDVVDRIPGILASKTGYTDLSGGNLAIVFDAGIDHPVAAVVLGSTYDGRFRDMLQLVNASTEKLSN